MQGECNHDSNHINSFTGHGGGFRALSATLQKLPHLDLSGRVTEKSSEPLTFGGYSDIFRERYVLTGGAEMCVAVKRPRTHAVEDRDAAFKRLAEETKIWSKVKHPNVLPLLGFIWRGGHFCLVSEWMPNGSLANYVRKHPECDIVYMLIGIARGLVHLHGIGVIHADVKADNVLVSSNGEPLLCDFGISRRLTMTPTVHVTSSPKGSLRWMSPELLCAPDDGPSPKHTESSDVWAFGVLAYELLTGRVPYDNLNDANVLWAILDGKLPQRPDGKWPSQLDRVWTLCNPVRGCCDKVPEQRPSMLRILGYLELCVDLVKNDADYTLADFTAEQWIEHDAFPPSPQPFIPPRPTDCQHVEGSKLNEALGPFPPPFTADDGPKNVPSIDHTLKVDSFAPLIPTKYATDTWIHVGSQRVTPPELTCDSRAATAPVIPLFSECDQQLHFRSLTHNLRYIHHRRSLYGRQSSSLNRSQTPEEDAPVSQLSQSEIQPNISIDEVLDQIQKVGSSTSAEEALCKISVLLDLTRSEAQWRVRAGQIRMKVFEAFCKTLFDPSALDLFSLEEFETMALDGKPALDPAREKDTDKALDIIALLIDIIRMGVGTCSDLVTAAKFLYERRQRQGYIPLLYLLLEAGKDFVYPYNDVLCLIDMKHHLQAENRGMVNEISDIIDGLQCARPA